MQVRTRVDVFEEIFLVFLGLGTLVGVVVIAYTLYNAYKYRDSGGEPEESRPTLGELPTGGEGGKKLFLSFGLSAIIVISLIIWTYGMLLYVEDGPDQNPEEAMEIDVEGWAFGWDFHYENGVETDSFGEGLVVPADTAVRVQVTSQDVWHTFGVPDLRVKADAIPGEYDETWFMADEPGEHEVQCFELCGPGHSDMNSPMVVLSQDEFDQWMDEQLTMSITVEDADGEPVTEGYELTLVHEENDQFEEDLEYTYGADEFENGTIEITEIERGGTYNLTITPEDDRYEPVEETVDFTGPTDETYTLEEADAENNDDDESDDESDDGGNGSDDGGAGDGDGGNESDDEGGEN